MDRETEEAREARVQKLWKSLHTGEITPLDEDGLKAGLKKIDHPLSKAENLLRDIFKNVDTSGDGLIEYSEFRAFVEHTEQELWRLFNNIDRDHNGNLDRDELNLAFKKAGVKMDKSKLDKFFRQVDKNHDGMISFDEWRDFLLFLPGHKPSLRAVSSYYQATVFSTAEGDTSVSDEGASGLGNTILFPLLFGVLFQIASYRPPRPSDGAKAGDTTTPLPSTSIPPEFPWDPGEASQLPPEPELQQPEPKPESEESLLIALLPDPGYFIAGGIAGAVSRTATAPLDRLKVYLIAQTGSSAESAAALKSGAPVRAASTAMRPLVDAVVALWRMGGIQSLFAGNGLNVVKVMPESAIKFGSYEGTKRIVAKFQDVEIDELGPWSQFFCAGMGGMISQFAVYPLDTLKFRMQCETVKGGLQGNALIIATAKKMYTKYGVRSYYRGLWMGLGGMFPYSALDLTTYEYLKRTIIERHLEMNPDLTDEEAAPGRLMTGGIGAVSSSFGASVVYPINLLRTRLQSQGTVIHPPTYNGWRDCLSKTVQQEGVKALYKGLTPNLLKVVPSMSISYMVYESSKTVLGLH